jgi:signal transduction histidine kinase
VSAINLRQLPISRVKALKSNLFIKTFIGFWLVSSIILASWLFSARYFDSLPDHPGHSRQEGPPRQFMLRLFYNLQNVSDDNLQKLVAQAQQQHNVDIFLFKPNGIELFNREITPGVKALARQLKDGRRRASADTQKGFMVGHRIHRDTDGALRAVVVVKPKKRGLLSLLNRSAGSRLTLAILISGLVCYALSRALTNRLRRLQLAARQLAGGDLDARVAVRGTGGDETDELGRNFNAMAAQLNGKIQGQKQLLSDVSHELRSPLARLRIALALAEEDPTEARHHLKRIETESESLETLIAQLLSAQDETFTADTYIDLVSLLQELCADTSFEGMNAGKVVTFSTPLQQAIIPSHADLLKRCFENILRNALKYTHENTEITVTLNLNDSAYVICVEDRGPGVDESELNNIFKEFYRVDNARQRETGGYGLGLSIARRAVEQHRGTLQAANTGTGLRVKATLPAHSAPKL